jgi:hypothetical protein
MQIGQSKPLNRRIKKPRQLWLSSILTLLIFATTISGYFLVQNSQDIRRSASEPYTSGCENNGGQCITGISACSDLYMQSISGTCSNSSARCCGTIEQFACDAGAKECIDDNTRRYCNSERTDWITAECPSGSTCSDGNCEFPHIPTPTPSSTCTSNGGQCIADISACSDVYMQSISGICSNSSARCCGTIEQFACDAGARECTSENGGRFCNSERTAWETFNCPSGSTCSDGNCEFPSAAATCQENGGQCMTGISACSDLYMQTFTGTCSNSSAKCCKTIEQFACDAGARECVDNKTLRFCNSERTAWNTQTCPGDANCVNGQCVFPCQGSCYSGSSCTSIGKNLATGTCPNTSLICCQDAPVGCQGSCYSGSSCSAIGKTDASGNCSSGLICCETQTAPTCEGTCYTNSSCAAIGKVAASGSCIQSTSICCQEAPALAQAGLKAKGEHCSNDSECITGKCARTYINNVGQPVFLGDYLCVPSIAEQDQSVQQQSQNAALLGAAGAVGATTIVAGGAAVGAAAAALPALTPLGVYSYMMATLATAPAWVQTGLTTAGLVSGWSAVGAGTYACVTNPNSDACSAYVAGLMADPTGLPQLASATDDFISSIYSSYLRRIRPSGQPVLVGDAHSDQRKLIELLKQQGVLDANGNPTGREAVFFGDYVGKSTNQLMSESSSGTPGIDTFEYVLSLRESNPELFTLLAGNWEPRYAHAMAAQSMGYDDQLQELLNKTVNLNEINSLLENPNLTRQQFGQLSYMTQLPDGDIAQHPDTAELMRYALSENDLSTLLNSSDPALKRLGQDFIAIQGQANPLSAQNLATIQDAASLLNLSPEQMINNVNYNAQSIVDNAIGLGQMGGAVGSAEYSAQAFMYNDIQTFHSQISGELTFFKPGASNLTAAMGSILETDGFVFGHTPVQTLGDVNLDPNLEYVVNPSGLTGVFNNTGIRIQDVDIGISRGMNSPFNPAHPRGFWPMSEGVIQVPENLWPN